MTGVRSRKSLGIVFQGSFYIQRRIVMNEQEFEKQLNLLIPHKTNTDKFFTASRGPIKIHTYSGITTSDPSKSQRANSKTSTKWYYATH